MSGLAPALGLGVLAEGLLGRQRSGASEDSLLGAPCQQASRDSGIVQGQGAPGTVSSWSHPQRETLQHREHVSRS